MTVARQWIVAAVVLSAGLAQADGLSPGLAATLKDQGRASRELSRALRDRPGLPRSVIARPVAIHAEAERRMRAVVALPGAVQLTRGSGGSTTSEVRSGRTVVSYATGGRQVTIETDDRLHGIVAFESGAIAAQRDTRERRLQPLPAGARDPRGRPLPAGSWMVTSRDASGGADRHYIVANRRADRVIRLSADEAARDQAGR